MAVTKDTISGDPMVGFNFKIEAEGQASGYFSEVSGISSETEVTEMKLVSGGYKEVVRKIPGRLKWGDITLKRGITANMDFWDWRQKVVDGKVDSARTNCTITMYDQANDAVAIWNLEQAWPSKLTGPSLNTDSSAVGIEELTLVCEGFNREK